MGDATSSPSPTSTKPRQPTLPPPLTPSLPQPPHPHPHPPRPHPHPPHPPPRTRTTSTAAPLPRSAFRPRGTLWLSPPPLAAGPKPLFRPSSAAGATRKVFRDRSSSTLCSRLQSTRGPKSTLDWGRTASLSPPSPTRSTPSSPFAKTTRTLSTGRSPSRLSN